MTKKQGTILRNTLKIFFEYFMLTFSSVLMACSYHLFLVPHKIVAGGAGGIAILISYIWNKPVGMMILLINIPLIIWGLSVFGKKFGFRTIYTIFVVSILTDSLDAWGKIKPVTDEILLATIYGAVLMGIGLGLAFKYRATTGGSDIIAQIMTKYTNTTPGMGIILIDFFIIAVSAYVFKNIDHALYGLMALFISSKLLDTILDGLSSFNKAAYIISDNYMLLKGEIMAELGRGGTLLNVSGFYGNDQKKMIFCVVNRREISQLVEIVKFLDPDAFMVITDAYKVLGLGFTDWKHVETD